MNDAFRMDIRVKTHGKVNIIDIYLIDININNIILIFNVFVHWMPKDKCYLK